MEHDKPEVVLPQVYEYAADPARSTEYSDSQNLRTLAGTSTPSVEDFEIEQNGERRGDQVW
jgi:yeast amino acid transporter